MKHGDEFRSLESDDDVFTIALDAALALLARAEEVAPPAGGREGAAASSAASESGEAVKLLDGRYGPYVTDGTTNASLPKGADPTR